MKEEQFLKALLHNNPRLIENNECWVDELLDLTPGSRRAANERILVYLTGSQGF